MSPSIIVGNALKSQRGKFLKQARVALGETLSAPDRHVIRAVFAAKNMESLFNEVFEQVMEWYSLHFPELRKEVRDPGVFLSMIVRIGARKNFSAETIGVFFQDEGSISRILSAAQQSAGGEMDDAVIKMVQGVADTGIRLKQEQQKLDHFVIKEMTNLSPNFSELATPLIAAQLLGKAGSMKRLSELPASTLQVLGAEEALFSHLKAHTSSPKHGYLFNHPLVKPLPKHARGRMARTLSGKLAICIRVDVFGGKRVVDDYKPKLEALSKKLAGEKGKKPPFRKKGYRK